MSAVAFGTAPRAGGERIELRARRVAHVFELPTLVGALLVVPVILLQESSVSHHWRELAAILNWGIWLVFAAETGATLAVSPGRRVEWLRHHPLEVAIVVLTPPFLPAGLQALRVFRLLRLLRLAVFARKLRLLLTPGGVRFAAVVAGVAALAGGTIFAEVEKGHSVGDGVWWAVATMTTVGYGDLAPKTVAGRLVAVTLMVIGVCFFALLTGAVAQRFLVVDVLEAETEIVTKERSGRDDVLRELRAVAVRLQELERLVERL
jgi:voltage-gated potassium channel